MKHAPRTFAAILAVLWTAQPAAAAEQIRSVYTTFNADKCRHTPGKEEEDYGTWSCPGYGKLRVRLSAGDQRMYVSYGAGKDKDIASSQTLPGFNDVYEGTVEWRMEMTPDGKSRPFATILRWNAITGHDQEGATGPVKATGRVLVVTRLGPGGICHVGYVDARANPNANELARKIADEHARIFRCGTDKRIILGTTSPDLPLPRDDK
jgi:hypothetical protein